MPESPDFESIARALFKRLQDEWMTQRIDAEVTVIAEQLRQVWNARGAADGAKLEAELSEMIATRTTHERLAAALRTLDR